MDGCVFLVPSSFTYLFTIIPSQYDNFLNTKNQGSDLKLSLSNIIDVFKRSFSGSIVVQIFKLGFNSTNCFQLGCFWSFFTRMVGALCTSPTFFTWLMITQMYVVYRLAMVEFVETLLYLVHLGTCDSKRRRMSMVLNLFTILSGLKEFLLTTIAKVCPKGFFYLFFACEKDAAKRSSGRKMVSKVHLSVGNLMCLKVPYFFSNAGCETLTFSKKNGDG